MKQSTDILVLILTACGIIASFYGAYRVIYKWWQGYKDKANAAFNGNWSNGGQYNMNPSHYIDVKIYGSDNEIKGSINLRKWNDDNDWHNVFLLGKRTFKRIICQIIEVKGREQKTIGKISFKRHKKKLQWILKEQNEYIFPKVEFLHKDLPVIG
jgi:hypothetical protein